MGIVFLLLLLAQFEPEPRFGVSVLQEQQDLDRNELNQLVSRLLDFRDADHREPTSGRPRWSLRRQLRGDGRWYWRYFS